MGTSSSKELKDSREEDPTPGSIPSTPILTPKLRSLENDPRSPSTNISRTPIEVLKSADISIDQQQDTFNINSPMVSKLLLDPRSPIPPVEFIRTPIVAAVKNTLKLHNKNFDNVRNAVSGFASTPIRKQPILLDSTPIIAKTIDKNKRKSFAGLLETNLDYVETDLDQVFLRKSLSNLCDVKFVKTPLKSVLCKVDPRSPSIDFLRTPICLNELVLNKTGEIEVNANDSSVKYEIDDEDGLITNVTLPNNNENIVEISEVVEEKEIEINNDLDHIVSIENIVQDIVEDVFNMDDLKNNDILPRIIATSPKPRKIIQNFDKKITNLIYEDQNMNAEDSPVKAKSKGGNRTPLSDRNGQNNTVDKKNKKTAPRLKVSDKPRKSQYAVSKIPVFRENKLTKLSQQCENTLPRKNKSLWDQQDNTLII